MSWIDALRNLFKAGATGLNDFERAVMQQVCAQLPGPSAARLKRRMDGVNLVQRLDGGRETNCMVMVSGVPKTDRKTRVDESSGKKLLAKVVVEGPPGTANAGEVWMVSGNLSAFMFEQPTAQADAAAITAVRVELGPLELADEAGASGGAPVA